MNGPSGPVPADGEAPGDHTTDVSADAPEVTTPADRATARPPLRLALALPVSAAAGLLLVTAFPPLGWWPIVFVVVPAALVALMGRRSWSALLVGLAFGAAFFFPNLSFTARYLGPEPWIALAALETVLTGVLAMPIAWAYRWFPPRRWVRLTLLPALVAGLWVMRELVLGCFPYGGYPWGRLGVTQASGPFADLASWIGMSGLGFVIVYACAAAIEVVRVARWRDIRVYLPAVVAVVLLAVVPQFPTTDAGDYTVGAVQGDGPSGYFDQRSPGDILQSQLDATQPLLGQSIDLLAWPEGATEFDPTQDPNTAATLTALSERIAAPLLVGAITERGDELFNSSLVWEAGAADPVATYDKRHPVPFGEYVPDRPFFRLLAPDLIDLIGREYTPGTAAPVVDIDGTKVGLGICFDVIYDDVAWDAIDGGAELFVFQTNNADFRGTDENLQQLAFARMRAIETGRSVINISTVGTSQAIAPDGTVLAELPADTAGHLLVTVPLRTGLTPAVVAGPALTLVLGWGSALAIALLGGIRLVTSRRRRRTPAPEAGTGVAEASVRR